MRRCIGQTAGVFRCPFQLPIRPSDRTHLPRKPSILVKDKSSPVDNCRTASFSTPRFHAGGRIKKPFRGNPGTQHVNKHGFRFGSCHCRGMHSDCLPVRQAACARVFLDLSRSMKPIPPRPTISCTQAQSVRLISTGEAPGVLFPPAISVHTSNRSHCGSAPPSPDVPPSSQEVSHKPVFKSLLNG